MSRNLWFEGYLSALWIEMENVLLATGHASTQELKKEKKRKEKRSRLSGVPSETELRENSWGLGVTTHPCYTCVFYLSITADHHGRFSEFEQVFSIMEHPSRSKRFRTSPAPG